MSLRLLYRKKITPLIRKLPCGARLNVALVAFRANLQTLHTPYPNSVNNRVFSDYEIDEIFNQLDADSINSAKRFMHRQILLPRESFFIHPNYFYTNEEQDEYKKLLPEYKALCKKYGFSFSKRQVGVESLYYHHGLRFAPDFVKNNIAGKLFADVGGYLGDSTLVFMNYSPEKVIIFEPIEDCRNQLITVLNKNSIAAEKYDIQPVGLSDQTEIFSNMQCHTLDSISQIYATPFGVLKADIEGMGLKFVKGAEQTIKRDRPLLSLSIYHNADEFAGIYQTLKSWNLGYHFEIKIFSPLVPYGELSLFGYPQEWIK